MGNPDFGSEFSIPAPYVNWRKTKILKNLFAKTGVKIYFRGQLSVTVKADVSCVRCGKSTRYSGVGVTVTKTLWIPKTIEGFEVNERTATMPIPGLNVALLSLEVKESYETIKAVQREIDSVLKAVRDIRGVFKCHRDGVDKEAAAKALVKVMGRKRDLEEEEFTAELSEEEVSLALNAALSSDNDADRVIQLPDVTLDADEETAQETVA